MKDPRKRRRAPRRTGVPRPHRRPAAGEGHCAGGRCRAGPQAVHGQPGDPAQPPPRQWCRPAARCAGPAQDRQDRPEPEPRNLIQDHLDIRWSPEQICQAVRPQFLQWPEMHVVYERSTGPPRLGPGRVAPRTGPPPADQTCPAQAPLAGPAASAQVPDSHVVMINKRPAEAESVRDALVTTVQVLPSHLRRSLTWDRGTEQAATERHRRNGRPGLFCDPASPWQRGSGENTYWCSLNGPGFIDGKDRRDRQVTWRSRTESPFR